MPIIKKNTMLVLALLDKSEHNLNAFKQGNNQQMPLKLNTMMHFGKALTVIHPLGVVDSESSDSLGLAVRK